MPGWDGKDAEGADQTGKVVGTKATRDVSFIGCRMHDIGLDQLADTMTDGVVTVVGGLSEGVSVRSGAHIARLFTAAKGDPMLQLSRDASSINTGWTLRMDVSGKDALVLRHNNTPAATLTADGEWQSRSLAADQLSMGRASPRRVIDGTLEVSRSRIAIQTEKPVTLRSLKGGSEGALAILELGKDSAPIALESAPSGNLRLTQPFRLEQPLDRIMLQRVGDLWIELSRSDFE